MAPPLSSGRRHGRDVVASMATTRWESGYARPPAFVIVIENMTSFAACLYDLKWATYIVPRGSSRAGRHRHGLSKSKVVFPTCAGDKQETLARGLLLKRAHPTKSDG